MLNRGLPGVHVVLWLPMLLLAVAAEGAGVDVAESGDDPSLIVIDGTKTRWGFDGTVQSEQFNLVSVLVKNTSLQPWEGAIELTQSLMGNRPRGLVLRQPLMLGPQESRWVQFTPYLADNLDVWTLVWGPGDLGRHELNAPPTGPRATVLIYDSDAVSVNAPTLPRMAEDLFPQSPTALAGLRGIILAHVPFWTGARVRTLLEWLNVGGRIYLVQDANGRFPQFPESLAVLNQAADEFRVGAGMVRRLPIPVDELTGDLARREIYHDDLPANVRQQSSFGRRGFTFGGRALGWSRHETAFGELRIIALFQRPWLLIYLAVLGYLLVLYPGCYRLGHERAQVRWFYLAFFGASLLFSLLFIGLGQVGGKEQSRLRSTGVARAAAPGVYHVNRWTLACVRDEGTYHLVPPGTGGAVTTWDDGENMRPAVGAIDVMTGDVSFEMATTATQSFLERTRVVSPVHPPQLLAIDEVAGRVLEIKVDPGADFHGETYAAWLVRDQTMFPLNIKGSQWKLDRTKSIETVSGLLNVDTGPRWGTLGFWVPWMSTQSRDELKSKAELEVFKRLEPLLIAEAFGLTDNVDSRFARTSPGMVRILAHRSIPADFRHGETQFADQRGSLLFVYEIDDPTVP